MKLKTQVSNPALLYSSLQMLCKIAPLFTITFTTTTLSFSSYSTSLTVKHTLQISDVFANYRIASLSNAISLQISLPHLLKAIQSSLTGTDISISLIKRKGPMLSVASRSLLHAQSLMQEINVEVMNNVMDIVLDERDALLDLTESNVRALAKCCVKGDRMTLCICDECEWRIEGKGVDIVLRLESCDAEGEGTVTVDGKEAMKVLTAATKGVERLELEIYETKCLLMRSWVGNDSFDFFLACIE